MKNLIIAASALLAGTAALSQTAPVAQPAPTPAVSPPASAPMPHPIHDRTMTRAEVVQMVRDHFGKMDANKDGSITTAEIDELHATMAKDFDKYKDRGHVMMMGDPNAAFDKLDTDKNGSISREEFTKAREERIERRVVIREERKKTGEGAKDGKDARHAVRMHRMGGLGGHMITMADSNKDGRITLAEAEAMALQHFDEMDKNKDGQVTREERREGRRIIIERKIEEK
ncbi:MAG TPA: EF-hand domain-containing protein [Sphingomicrobium sp.]|nr:EF-hand domain-containing protein [Sphingomicrobium sp.]